MQTDPNEPPVVAGDLFATAVIVAFSIVIGCVIAGVAAWWRS